MVRQVTPGERYGMVREVPPGKSCQIVRWITPGERYGMERQGIPGESSGEIPKNSPSTQYHYSSSSQEFYINCNRFIAKWYFF